MILIRMYEIFSSAIFDCRWDVCCIKIVFCSSIVASYAGIFKFSHILNIKSTSGMWWRALSRNRIGLIFWSNCFWFVDKVRGGRDTSFDHLIKFIYLIFKSSCSIRRHSCIYWSNSGRMLKSSTNWIVFIINNWWPAKSLLSLMRLFS